MLYRGDRRTMTTKQVRETEAEAVAFVVCQSVGLQNGTASQDYIQLWHGDANLLRESLEVVQRTSAVILGAISPKDAVSASATTEVLGSGRSSYRTAWPMRSTLTCARPRSRTMWCADSEAASGIGAKISPRSVNSDVE